MGPHANEALEDDTFVSSLLLVIDISKVDGWGAGGFMTYRHVLALL